jgi:8-oxo-dGTP diphosphatase
MKHEINDLFGNRTRVRVCGLCWRKGELLLVNHTLANGDFWAPPGGGLEFGEPVELRLKKEFAEETGLLIQMGAFQFGCEFIAKPLHAIELFFQVTVAGGALVKGEDPEISIIKDVRFMSFPEIAKMPAQSLHGIFKLVPSPEHLRELTGFFRI